jgi:hypothetical protein
MNNIVHISKCLSNAYPAQTGLNDALSSSLFFSFALEYAIRKVQGIGSE